MVVEIPHETLGSVRSLGNPIRLSRTPAVIDRPPPALGEHNEEILAGLSRPPGDPEADAGTAGEGRADTPPPVAAAASGARR